MVWFWRGWRRRIKTEIKTEIESWSESESESETVYMPESTSNSESEHV